MKRIFSSVILAAVFLSLLGQSVFSEARASQDQIDKAVSYLNLKPQNPWITMAIAAVGKEQDVSYLKNFTGDEAIDFETPILAIAASGQDPRTFPDDNLVVRLKSFYLNGQIGNSEYINDDIFGIMALTSAGEDSADQVIQGAKNFIVSNRNADGGWSWDAGGSSGADMTAAATMALLEAGVQSSDSLIQGAESYLRNSQNGDGGFGSALGEESNASSTAWAISAFNKLGKDPNLIKKGDNNPIDYLLSLQEEDGYFETKLGAGQTGFTPVETSYAVIALSGKSYPVKKIEANLNVRVKFRIEGSSSQFCQGSVDAKTAMDAVKNAADLCGYDYEIQSTSFGPYLVRINSDRAAGLEGWLYFVDYESPSVGAADYKLSEGEEVLWYFGEWGWFPTRLGLTKESNSAKIFVEFYEKGTWKGLSGAKVSVGDSEFLTDGSGWAIASFDSLDDGLFWVFAEKEGFIRSNREGFSKNAASSGQKVGLKATLEQPDTPPPPPSVGFSVQPSTLDFGVLKPGQSAEKEITLSNTGSLTLSFRAEVAGDDVFENNLKIEDNFWPFFSDDLGVSESENIGVELSLPLTYSGVFGDVSGELTFWASAK